MVEIVVAVVVANLVEIVVAVVVENLVEIVVAVVVENLVEYVLEMWEPPYWYKYWLNGYFQINSSPLQLQLGDRAGLYYQKIHKPFLFRLFNFKFKKNNVIFLITVYIGVQKIIKLYILKYYMMNPILSDLFNK